MDHSDGVPTIRVRSIPAGHDYVRHGVGSAAGVLILDDPLLDPADPARWWPHPALEAAERPGVLDGADLVHMHFGYEHRSPQQVARFVAAVRRRGIALVVTVHDLSNPHEADPAAHLARTGQLVRGADAVITLTDGAAAEIRRRWGAAAHVIPHPRLMPATITEPHRLRRLRNHDHRDHNHRDRPPTGSPDVGPGPRTVGVVLGSLRAGVAVEGLLPRLAEALPAGTTLVVMVRVDALAAARDPDHARHDAALALDRLVTRTDVEVRPHELLTDDELCGSLAAFDTLVLPHRHGTHSGWLELCRDLGLPPVVPNIGCLSEQWGSGVSGSGVSGSAAGCYDPGQPGLDSLRQALRTALSAPPVPARTADAEDAAVAAAHAKLYRAALARVTHLAHGPVDAPQD